MERKGLRKFSIKTKILTTFLGQVHRPDSFICPFGLLTMGYSTAAAIGGKLATPDRPVVSLVGDGCFLMNGMEIATAVSYDIPVVWIVQNNAKLGLVHEFQRFEFWRKNCCYTIQAD